MPIFFLSLFLLIFFEVKCVVDRYKWHRPFQMATTVLRNGNDRFKWQRPFTKGKFASLSHPAIEQLGPAVGDAKNSSRRLACYSNKTQKT